MDTGHSDPQKHTRWDKKTGWGAYPQLTPQRGSKCAQDQDIGITCGNTPCTTCARGLGCMCSNSAMAADHAGCPGLHVYTLHTRPRPSLPHSPLTQPVPQRPSPPPAYPDTHSHVTRIRATHAAHDTPTSPRVGPIQTNAHASTPLHTSKTHDSTNPHTQTQALQRAHVRYAITLTVHGCMHPLYQTTNPNVRT